MIKNTTSGEYADINESYYVSGKDICDIEIPVENKLNLTVMEAAVYSNIGQNKIASMLRNPMCNFVLCVGNKRLVKRKEFEEFLAGRAEV